MFVPDDVCSPDEFCNAFIYLFIFLRGPTCLTRCWQWNNAVLFIFCFDTSFCCHSPSCLQFQLWARVCLWMRLLLACLLHFLWAFKRPANVHREYKSVRRVGGTFVLPVVHWCALWPPSSPPFPCHEINQTSGCQNAREHFYPVMPTYSLILSTYIKSLCLLDILFLAETSQPCSRGK